MFKVAILIAILGLSLNTDAKDLGFRYKNGKCVNDVGVAGYNTGYIGQCSDLRGVIMSRFVLDDVDLQGSLLDSADLQNTSFKRANLSHVVAKQANFNGVDFEGAILHESDFSQTQLLQSHLGGADILKLDLSGADLSDSKLSYFKCPGCKVAGTKFARAVMDNSDLRAMNLSGADFSDADLQKAILDGVKLDGANLERASLLSASLVGVSAVNAKMRRVILRQTNLKGAVLQGSDLNAAQFDNANLENANLQKTNLAGAIFTGATYKGAKFAGAKFNRRSVLPFSKEDALKQGMVEGSGGVYILWDVQVDTGGLPDLKKFLESRGVEIKISSQGHALFDATDDYTEYDAFFHMFSEGYLTDLNPAAQAALNQYVKNGGTYIATAWSGFAVQNRNYFNGMLDLIFIPYDSYIQAEQTFMPLQGKEGHPLLADVTFPMKMSGYITAGQGFLPPSSMLPDPETILVDGNKNIIAAIRTIGDGRVVNFAFVPDVGYNVLTLPAVQQLIMNAIEL